MKILVINSGSSSLKFELIDMTNEKTLAKGICERVGIANPIFTYKNLVKGTKIDKQEAPMENHSIAIDLVLKTLQDKEHGVITNVDEIDAIGHRVVHGGEYYDDSVVVDDEVIKNLESESNVAFAVSNVIPFFSLFCLKISAISSIVAQFSGSYIIAPSREIPSFSASSFIFFSLPTSATFAIPSAKTFSAALRTLSSSVSGKIIVFPNFFALSFKTSTKFATKIHSVSKYLNFYFL